MKINEAGFKDQGRTMVILGGLLWLIGVCGFFLFERRLPQQMALIGAPASALRFGALIGALEFFVVGWGLMNARRWARAILLCYAWLRLGLSIAMTPVMFWFAIHLSPTDPRMSTGVRTTGAVMLAVGMLISIGISYAFVRFFSSPDTIRTCETKNPEPSWTDNCPLPLLGLIFLLGYNVITGIAALPLKAGYPLMTTAVHGPSATALSLLFDAGYVYSAYLLYRRQVAGWWLGVGICAFASINALVFLAVHGWQGMTSLLAYSSELAKTTAPSGLGMIAGGAFVGGAIGLFAYFLYVKNRYFPVGGWPGDSPQRPV
jgi:hypothetical protein